MKPLKRKAFFETSKVVALILLGIVCLANVSYAAEIADSDLEIFQEANVDYKGGDFKDAVQKFQQLADKYPGETAFQYNLGNSLFRLKKNGQAILAYERAKVSEPRSKNIRDNLKYVNDILEYRMEDKRNWYVQKGEELLTYLRVEESYLLMALALCLLLLSWVYTSYFKGGQPWGWFRKTLLVLFALSLILVGLKVVEKNIIRDAIVITKKAEVRYGPSVEDKVAFQLGEGLKVYVIDSRENWSRVLLSNKETGWMKNSQIAKV